MRMDAPNQDFALAGGLEELKQKGRLVVNDRDRSILVIYDRGRVFALDNLCPHMGFPLEGGSVEDGILTCPWHRPRFDIASVRTFDVGAACGDGPGRGAEWRAVGEDHVRLSRSRRALASAACGWPRL